MSGAGQLMKFEATVPAAAGVGTTFDVLRDLPAHLEWAGKRSTMKHFRLLELDAPAEPATVGTRFTSTGANDNGTFHDEGVVTAAAPGRFAFEVSSRLDRKHGREWRAHFTHDYRIEPDGAGTRIVYACVVHDGNYVPYWLRPGVRQLTRAMVNRMITKQLGNLAALAEERERLGAPTPVDR
jgi:hypothetical protein